MVLKAFFEGLRGVAGLIINCQLKLKPFLGFEINYAWT